MYEPEPLEAVTVQVTFCPVEAFDGETVHAVTVGAVQLALEGVVAEQLPSH